MALLPDDQWLLIRPQSEYNLVLLADCCGEKQTVKWHWEENQIVTTTCSLNV